MGEMHFSGGGNSTVAPAYVAGIDCGSRKTRCVILAVGEGHASYVGSGEVESQGWAKGRIVDTQAVSNCIAGAVERARGDHQILIEEAVFGIGGSNFSASSWSGFMHHYQRPGSGSEETPSRVSASHETMMSAQKRLTRNRKRLILRKKLTLECPPIAEKSLEEAARLAGIRVLAMYAEPFAATEAAISPYQLDPSEGVLVIDIGAQSSGYCLSRFDDIGAGGLLLGVDHIARNVAFALDVPIAQARCCIDSARFEALQDKERAELEPLREPVVEELRAATLEFAFFVGNEINESVLQIARLPNWIVLTGGGAKLEGIADAFERVFWRDVQIGGVDLIWEKCPESFRKAPEWCTAFGLADLSLAMHGRPEEVDILKLLGLPEE